MPDRRLNVLVYPMWSVDSVNADSNYIIIKQICNQLVPTGRFNFWVVMDSNRKYVKDDLHPFVKLIGLPFPRSKKLQVQYWNTSAIRKIFNEIPIDLVWNNVVEKGHYFKWWADCMDPRGRMLVFNYHHYVIHRSLPKQTYYDVCQHILADQISGSLEADVNYFHTKHCRNMLMEEATDWLSPKKKEVIESKSITRLGGYCEPQEPREKHDRFTFVYNHRLAGYKNWKTTWEVFDQLHAEGYDFQVLITGGDKDGMAQAERKYTTIRSFKTHADYLAELQRCHANVINSRHETYCIAIAESMMADQIIIAPRAVTFPELLGDDYPYLFDSVEEQTDHMRKILDEGLRKYEHDKSRLTIKSHAEFIGRTFDEMYDRAKGDSDILANMRDPSKKKLFSEWLGKRPSFRFQEFVKVVRKGGLQAQIMPLSRIKMILDQQGYKHNILTDKFER